jgi:PhoH-like ATPase
MINEQRTYGATYTGYQRLCLTEEELATFYSKNIIQGDFLENEYVVLEDDQGQIIDLLKLQDGYFVHLDGHTIKNQWTDTIKPRNTEQKLMFDALEDRTTPLKIFTGTYGSGKSFLTLNKALELIEHGQFSKIVYLRNNINVKGTEPIGALPGSIDDKQLPWLLPIADIVGGLDGLEMLMDSNKLEAVPLGFIRGRSFNHAIIISDESENLTKELYQLIIGRVGEGSELWLLSDFRQSDFGVNKFKIFEDGTPFMIDRLKGNRMVSVVNLPTTERSKVANLSNLLDD